TLAAWLAIAALGAWFLYRVTGQRWLALAGLLVGFMHLDRLALEPGHPQELCLLGIMGCLLVASHLGRTTHRLSWTILLGLLVGIVVTIKVNVGALLFLALLVALLVPLSSRRAWRYLLFAMTGAGMLLPLVITHSRLLTIGGCLLPLVVAISFLAAVCVAVATERSRVPARRDSESGPPGRTGLRDLAGFLTGFLLAVVTVCTAVIASGSSLHGLIQGLVGQHLGSGRWFYADAPISWLAVPWAVVCLCVALRARRVWLTPVLALIAVAVVVQQALETCQPLEHGLVDRSFAGLLVGFATPAVWALLLTGRLAGNQESAVTRGGRLSLCLIATLQPLGAYPIPGTQMAIGSYALLLAALVGTADCWRFLQLRISATGREPVAWLRLLAVCSLLVLLARGTYLREVRNSYEPLGLPGAQRLCRPADEVMEKRWLAATLQSRADTFVCAYEAKNSYYFWTRLQPPTPLNANYWPGMLDAGQQQSVAAALGKNQRTCVVWHHEARLQPAGPTPLAEYLKANFRPWRRRGSIEIWVPRSAPDSHLSAR
ncbi:MAG: hypothetical protein OES79_03620, partial [Planctomycetota bacterium]|nr:hypothetical protein [Planctomycetota bacterium]